MRYEVNHGPAFALLTVGLDEGESVRAESGAMMSHDAGIEMETNATGGFLSSVRRSVLGGESFFQNTFTAREPGEVTFGPPLPGDITTYDLSDETLYVQSGSYLASDPSLETDTKFGGSRSFFGSEGLFLLKLSGTGTLGMSSYGAIDERELAEGERFVIDTGHVVAFEESTDFTVRRVGGLKSTLLSGEGLVCEFTGPGTVWTQTRSMDAFLAWLLPKLPTNSAPQP
jgi:uncharacterized protein (TIGR00266 family)